MRHVRSTTSRLLGCLLLACAACTGCAALSNPTAEGIPVRYLPAELLAAPRDEEVPIPLTCLQQPTPPTYRLAPGDTLGIWIDGIFPLGAVEAPAAPPTPPVHVSPPVLIRDQRRLSPAAGYPVPVDEDGAVSLPLVEPVKVAGLTVSQAREAIRKAYTTPKQLLKPGNERVLVTLLQQRVAHVTVFRQESGLFLLKSEGSPVSGAKRGTGQVVDLPGYENDVLHALAQTGGLPGLDAFNEIIVQRGGRLPADGQWPFDQPLIPGAPCGEVLRIPLRMKPDEKPPIQPKDVVLQTGDVVYLEARDDELFYTGGLLPAGEWVLPRDHDLDVVEAIAQVRGAMVNGAFNTNNLSGTLIATGIGNPSPSLVTVLRRTHGGQVPIRVDLSRALVDARERIIVQPGDVLLLQEKPCEAMARYFSQTFMNFSLTWQVLHERWATGLFDISAPERVPSGRIGVTNLTASP